MLAQLDRTPNRPRTCPAARLHARRGVPRHGCLLAPQWEAEALHVAPSPPHSLLTQTTFPPLVPASGALCPSAAPFELDRAGGWWVLSEGVSLVASPQQPLTGGALQREAECGQLTNPPSAPAAPSVPKSLPVLRCERREPTSAVCAPGVARIPDPDPTRGPDPTGLPHAFILPSHD